MLALVVLALGASIVFSQQAAKKANEGVVMESHIKGNPEASVTLVEYSDFQCPACAQFQPLVKELVEEHGDQLRFEYRHFPLVTIHPYAVPAAQAAEAAAQQGKFFEMHDLLFENQSTWSQGGNPDAYFIQYAEELGLDISTFRRHLSASVITDSVRGDFRKAQELGLRGTPSFYLNDQQMNYETFDDFISQIEAALGVSATTTDNGSESETTTAEEVGVEFGI